MKPGSSGAKSWKNNRKAHQLYRNKLSMGPKLTQADTFNNILGLTANYAAASEPDREHLDGHH